MIPWKIAHTCDDLGMCQDRKPACVGCTAQRRHNDLPRPTYPFAPGVIDYGPKPVTPAVTKWLVRWVYLMLVVVALCFVAGYLS